MSDEILAGQEPEKMKTPKAGSSVFGKPVSESFVSEGTASEIPASEGSVAEIPVSEGSVAEIPVSEIPASEGTASEIPAFENVVSESPALGKGVSENKVSRIRLLRIPVYAILILSVLWALQRLLVPKYMGRVIEGRLIPEYYEETSDHDLLILGDCEVYENISPVILWKEFGITSYIRGSAQQLIPQSYYLLEDTLRREHPKAVLLSVAAMQEGEQTNEAYNRMTMEGMEWSKVKIDALNATMMEEENLAEYLFPLLRYHSRFKELSKDDFRYFWHGEKVSHNGYYMRADVRPLADFPTQRRLADYRFPEISVEYLEKIRLLCEKEGIRLVLMKAPSLYPAWYDQWEAQIQEYASGNGLTYINCIPKIQEIGLDFNRDTYDGGLHMNVYGAEKLTIYLGSLLKDECGLGDHRGEQELDEIWQQKILFYDKMKEQQEADVQEYGFLPQFTDER